jgi:hypothetical protein
LLQKQSNVPSSLCSLAFERGLHFRLRVDAQRVRNAVDVIEVGNHLHGVQDIPIAEPVLAQGAEVLDANGGGRARQEFRESGKRFLAWREPGAEIILLDAVGQLGVTDFLTEILSVGFDSI